MTQSIYALLASRFEEKGDAPFTVEENGSTIAYSQIDEATARIGAVFKLFGLNQGDRIIVQADKSVLSIMIYLASLRFGIIFVPLNTAYTARELSYFLADAAPAMVIISPERHAATMGLIANDANPAVLTLDGSGNGSFAAAVKHADARSDMVEISANDPAVLVYTSGTTGRSKGAVLSHGNLASNALALFDLWQWRSDDVLIHALPIFHIHGLFVALHTAMLGGSKILFHKAFNPRAVLRDCAKATVLMGVPTFYTRLLDEPELDVRSTGKMRLFISGSAPLSESTFHAFRARTGHTILERYGMSEAGIIASNPVAGARVAGTVGFALPGFETRITALDDAQSGILEIRGPSVFKGYWNMPEKTREEFTPDGFFITGDIALIAADQRISIIGRAKDLVISGGYNIYPKEVEQQIDALADILESAVIGVPHPDLGEAVVAAIVPIKGRKITEAQIRAQLSVNLARYKQPRKVVILSQLPRNAMGKVQKNALRTQLAGLFS